MQVTNTTAATATLPLNAAASRAALPGQDFLAALKAAEAAELTVAPAVGEETAAAGNETAPIALYQSAGGRIVEQSQSRLKYWDDEYFARVVSDGTEIDTSNTINWEATGEKKLTQEQIAQLKKKYDVTNLSSQDYYDLMSELTHMDVLSAEDCIGVNTLYFGEEPPAFRLIPYPYKHLHARELCQTSGNLTKALSVALELLRERLELIDSDEYMRVNNITEEARALDRAAMEKNIQSRQAVLNLLNQLR